MFLKLNFKGLVEVPKLSFQKQLVDLLIEMISIHRLIWELKLLWHDIFVFVGGHDKIPQTGWLKQQIFISS